MRAELLIALLLALNAVVNFWIYRDIHSFFSNIVEVREGGPQENKNSDGGIKND